MAHRTQARCRVHSNDTHQDAVLGLLEFDVGAGLGLHEPRCVERAADERELLVPGHFGGAGALEVRRSNGGFALGEWANFTPGTPKSTTD